MRRAMQEIIPGLYLGPYGAATKAERQNLLNHNIKGIVCCRSKGESRFIKPNFPDEIEYLTVEMDDARTEMAIPHFAPVIQFIESFLLGASRRGAVLVHDDAGISRAPTLVVAYLMYHYGIDSNLAMRLVHLRRFCIFPIDNFRAQLLEYEPLVLAKRQYSLIARSPELQAALNIELSNVISAAQKQHQEQQQMSDHNYSTSSASSDGSSETSFVRRPARTKRSHDDGMDDDEEGAGGTSGLSEFEHVPKCSAIDEEQCVTMRDEDGEESNPRVDNIRRMLI